MSQPSQGITSKVEAGSERTPKEDVALEKEIARVRRQMEEEKAAQDRANGEAVAEDPYEYKTPFYPKPLYKRWEPGHQEWQPSHARLSHLYRSPSDAPPPRPYHHTRLPRRLHVETLVEEDSNKATANSKLSRREARRVRKIHKRNPALKKYLSSSARVLAPGEEQPVRKPKTGFDRIVERFITRNWHPEVVQELFKRGIDIKDFPTGDLTRKLNQDKGRIQWLIKRKFRKVSHRLHQRFSSEVSDTLGIELATLSRDCTIFPDLQYFKDSGDQRTPPRFCPQITLPKERERGPAYDKHLNPAGVDLQIWLTTPEEAEDHYRRQQAYLAHRSASNNWLRIQGRKQIDDWLIGRAPPISQRRLNRVIEHHLARQPIPSLKHRPLQLEEADIGIREPPRADNIVAWEALYLANRVKPTFKKDIPLVQRAWSESEDHFNTEECDITSAPRVRDSSPGRNHLPAPVPQEYPKSSKSAKPSPLRTVAFQADEPPVRKPSVPRSNPLIAEAHSFRKYCQENPGLQGIIKDSIQSGKFFKRTKVKNEEPLRTAAILIETEITQTFEPAPGYESTQTNPKPSAAKGSKSSGPPDLKKLSSKDLSSLKKSKNSDIQSSEALNSKITSKSKDSSGVIDVPRAQHIENQNQLPLETPVVSKASTKHTSYSEKTSSLQKPPPLLVSSFDFEEKLPSSATPTSDKRDPFATPDKDRSVLKSPFSDSDSASASSPCPVKQYNRRPLTPLKESVTGSSVKGTKEIAKQFLNEAHQRLVDSHNPHRPPILSDKQQTGPKERSHKDLDCHSYELQVLPKAHGSVSSLLRNSLSGDSNLPAKGPSSPVVPESPSYELQVLPQAYGSVFSLLNNSLPSDHPSKESSSPAIPEFENEASLDRCLGLQDKVSTEDHWSWSPCGDERFVVVSLASVQDQESFRNTSVQETTTQETTIEDLSSTSDIEETEESSLSEAFVDRTSFLAPRFQSSVSKTEDFRHSLDLLHVGGTFTEEFRLPDVPHVDEPLDLELCTHSEGPESSKSESPFADLHISSEAPERLHTKPEAEDHNPASEFCEAQQVPQEVNPLERPESQPTKEDLRTRQARLSLGFCKLLERSAQIKAQAPYCAQKETSTVSESSPVCPETSSNNSPSQSQALESLEDLVDTDCGRIPYRTALAQGAKVLCYEGRGQATACKFDRPSRRPNRVVANSPKSSFDNFEQPRVIHGVVVSRERLQARLQSLRYSSVLQPSDIVPSSSAASDTVEDARCSRESSKFVAPLDTRSLAEVKTAGTYDERELFERNCQRILEDRALYTIKTGSGVFRNVRDKKLACLKLDSSSQSSGIHSNQKGERDSNGFQSQNLPSPPTTPELPPPNIPDKSPLRAQGVECVDFAKLSAKDCGLKSSVDSASDFWVSPKPPTKTPNATFLAPILRVGPSHVHENTKALGAYNQRLQLEQESFFNMDSSRLSARPAQYSSQRSQQIEDARQMQQSVFEAAKKAGKDPPKYTLLQLIGKGAFGRVYKGKDMETAAVVAIKTIDIDESDTLNPRQADAYGDFLKEVNALTALSEIKARNINHVIEALPVGKSMWMITEYCAGGSVSTLMNPTKPGGLQEKWIIPIIREVAEAIRWVHSVKIIHRDIKCGNVLVTEQGGVQLCDFGISSMLDSKLDKRKTVIGTPNWMAPELFDGRAIYGQDIDIWAFGAMIYEIATGLPPNAGLAFDDIGTTLKKSAPRLEGGNYSNELRDLVAFCLEEIPSARPDIEDVEKHPYIYNTASKYPTSSLAGLVRAYKMWEDHGGSRKSLFMAGGAQGPSEVNSNTFDGEWNFSTTAAFDQQVDRESNPQDVFDAYGTSVELDTSFAQRSTPQKGRRRPPPQALAPIKNPLERVFDQKTMSNYNDNSRERYGFDGNQQEQQYDFLGDLPLRNDTIQQPTRESLIDLGGYDASMGISSFNDMDTIRASRRGRDEDIDDDYGETPSFNRPALSDPEQVGNNRRTQDWKFPSMAPPASADPEISRFPSSYNPPLPAMTPGSGGRPALIHHPTEPLGTAFGGIATSSALDRMSMSSLIDLDMSVPDPVDFSARPSTANSDVGSVTSELTSSRNPFEFEKHASRVPSQFDGADEANEPEIYVTNGGTHSRLQSGSSFRDMGDVSDFSASETEVPYHNGGHSRYVSEASDSDYITMAPPPRPAAQQQRQSSYNVGHFPDLPLPPSAAALSGTAFDREMAVEFHRMIDGLTGQLESFRDVYDELKPVTVTRRPSQRRDRDDDTA